MIDEHTPSHARKFLHHMTVEDVSDLLVDLFEELSSNRCRPQDAGRPNWPESVAIWI
jgi:hypothetical protein